MPRQIDYYFSISSPWAYIGHKPFRDAVYSLVARNRYRIFGKFDACIVPDAELKARVLE